MLQNLKTKFKHITGMWPKTCKFDSEADRLQSWQTTAVIKAKVYSPSKRLIICEKGVEVLEEEKKKYDDFLAHFRNPRKSADKNQ